MYIVKDLLVYYINSADSKDTTLGPGQQRLRANVCFARRKVNHRWVLAIMAKKHLPRGVELVEPGRTISCTLSSVSIRLAYCRMR
jgi:hypothetical protein